MTNFQIHFDEPWLLLLLIPAFFFALFPYFRLSKRYRRTRNRIISVVLHCLIMLLAVTLLAGIGFTYQIPNTENEVILLVDASDSSSDSRELKEEFIQAAINEKSPSIQMGIVTFGCDQVYAVPLTYDSDSIFDTYLNAETPDTTATDFESALRYARSLITSPESAKIVVISDGEETDGAALRYVRTLSADGIKIDTVYFPNENVEYEVRIVDAQFPDINIDLDSAFNLTLNLQSNYEGTARITVSDNGETVSEQSANLVTGIQSVTLSHTFSIGGLHDLTFRIESDQDTLTANNLYHAYYYVEVFNNVLIIENYEDESSELKAILDAADYSTTVVQIDDTQLLPASVDELRAFDEVILFNIGNDQLSAAGLDALLSAYVGTYGGSLFTVGENTYDRDQMYGSVYQEMLPVEAVDYTPPVAVVYIIDASGSMSGNALELAKDAAFQSLQTLTSRDWVGVMTLRDSYSEDLALTPVPQLSDIEAAIDSIESSDGTNYAASIIHAGAALSQLSSVQKRHIILISDAQPGDNLWDNAVEQTGGYGGAIQNNYETHGITCSIVSVVSGGQTENMQAAAELGHGSFYQTSNTTELAQMLIEDLRAPEITGNNPGMFTPRISDITPVVDGISQADMPQLGGYYGTRLKSGAVQPLITPYEDVPIYAQWDYGRGKVGSFMSDLGGEWSAEFLASETGIQIIQNIFKTLRPTESIRPQEVSLTLEEQNYTTSVNIFSEVEEGQSVELLVSGPDGSSEGISIVQPTAADFFSTASFTVRTPGVYTIVVQKKDANGIVLAETTIYKAFSYSAEYTYFVDAEEGANLLSDMALDGDGEELTEGWQVFENLVTAFDRSYDPRLLFAILIIVMFLLDVAVRKFKFKWPHEIIRDRREKKRLAQRDGRTGQS